MKIKNRALKGPLKEGYYNMDVSENGGTPKSSIFNRVFHHKPSILGYPYFWQHPYDYFPRCYKCQGPKPGLALVAP